MSQAEVLDGVVIVAIALAVGALELIGEQPRLGYLLFTTSAGRSYLLLNAAAAVIAYALVLALDVRFKTPNHISRILACGLTSTAVLRSGVIGQAGLRGPVQILAKLRAAYTTQLRGAVRARDARRAERLVEGLDFDEHGPSLVILCVRISGAGDAEKRRATDRLAELARTDLVPGARLYVLAGALRDQFGDDVLAEAARALRESAKG